MMLRHLLPVTFYSDREPFHKELRTMQNRVARPFYRTGVIATKLQSTFRANLQDSIQISYRPFSTFDRCSLLRRFYEKQPQAAAPKADGPSVDQKRKRCQ